MSHNVTCPHCETALHVGESAATSVTCPRCLGRLPNPALPADAGPFDNRMRSVLAVTDDDVRRDGRWSGLGLAVVIVLACVGVLSTVQLGVGLAAAAASESNAGAAVVAVALVVGLVGLVLGGVALVRWRRQPAMRQAGKVVLGVFAGIGAIVLSMLAMCVVLFLVCSAIMLAAR